MRARDTIDGLIALGAILLAAGAGAITWAAFGPLAAAGVAAVTLGALAIVAAVLLDLERAATDRERARHGETPREAGRE